jgi:alanyl aminopeptidase
MPKVRIPFRRAYPRSLILKLVQTWGSLGMPNYQRFLQKNFRQKARELGWIPKAGEPDDVRMLRSALVAAMATEGGDTDLSGQARQLAEKWLNDRKVLSPDVVNAVLSSAGYYADSALFQSFLAEFQKTNDRREQQSLLIAMTPFRDPLAAEMGMQAVLSKKVALADGFPLLVGARGRPAGRTQLDFVKTHFEELMKDHPSIFGFDFGSLLPYIGYGFCDSASRSELQAFFAPLVSQYTGAPRTLTQMLESMDLCIANKAAQQPNIVEFLKRY